MVGRSPKMVGYLPYQRIGNSMCTMCIGNSTHAVLKSVKKAICGEIVDYRIHQALFKLKDRTTGIEGGSCTRTILICANLPTELQVNAVHF